MWNPQRYRVLSPTEKPPYSVIVGTTNELPKVLDPTKFNLVVATTGLALEAQAYFDRLDLPQVVTTAPDKETHPNPRKVTIFRVPSGHFNDLQIIAERNLPDMQGRNAFIRVTREISILQRERLGESTEFECVINLPASSGILHYDIGTYWRSLWQPNHSEAPSDSTIVGDNSLVKGQKVENGSLESLGNPKQVEPNLIWVAPPSSLLFWTGEHLPPQRPHAEPEIDADGHSRFTWIAQNKINPHP